MPPKKRALAASKTPTRSSARTKDAAATKNVSATVPKKSSTTSSKASEKTTSSKTVAASRKAKDSNAPAKLHKSKVADAKPTGAKSAPPPRKRKADALSEEVPREPKKARVVQARAPKLKPKVVINHAPTTRLNVYVCGEGSSGELGLGPARNAVDVKRPRLNPLLPANEVGVVQVAVGGMHCIALTHDNKILTWGVNDQGALGRDTTWEGGYKDVDDNKSDSDSDDESDSGLNPRESTPTAIPPESFPEGTVFVEVAAGDSSSFALTDDGQVYGWGTFRVKSPKQISMLSYQTDHILFS